MTRQHIFKKILIEYSRETSYHFSFADVEPPVLNCGKEKIEVYAGPKLTKVSVQWPPVTAVDNSKLSYTVTSDIQSGALFEVGDTPVKFTAVDEQKNVGRCTKIISVIGEYFLRFNLFATPVEN